MCKLISCSKRRSRASVLARLSAKQRGLSRVTSRHECHAVTRRRGVRRGAARRRVVACLGGAQPRGPRNPAPYQTETMGPMGAEANDNKSVMQSCSHAPAWRARRGVAWHGVVWCGVSSRRSLGVCDSGRQPQHCCSTAVRGLAQRCGSVYAAEAGSSNHDLVRATVQTIEQHPENGIWLAKPLYGHNQPSEGSPHNALTTVSAFLSM